LAICLWEYQLRNKKVLFHTDNAAVASILNNKSSKYDRVMSLLRPTVYWTLLLNFSFKAKHVFPVDNCRADAISRGQVERFRRLAPSADAYPCQIPVAFWNLLCQKHQCHQIRGMHNHTVLNLLKDLEPFII
jgi:hypothetical protein